MLLLSELTPYPNDSVSKKNNIVNLSDKTLTTEQTNIQNKGLSVVYINNEELIRKVRLMEYHQNSDKHSAKETPLMKPQSNNWTSPSGRNIHVDSFVVTARKQCNNFLINNHPTQISNINEKHSLNELAKDNSVTIKEADKGGTSVCSKWASKGVLLCPSTHLTTSTVARIFCHIQQITKKYNKKHLKNSQVKQKT